MVIASETLPAGRRGSNLVFFNEIVTPSYRNSCSLDALTEHFGVQALNLIWYREGTHLSGARKRNPSLLPLTKGRLGGVKTFYSLNRGLGITSECMGNGV